MITLHTPPRYNAKEYLQGGYYDTAYRRPSPSRPSPRRDIPQAFMNTEWGRNEAQGLHVSMQHKADGPRPAPIDQHQPISDRTLPSSGSISYLCRARNENYKRLCDQARDRKYVPPTREHVLRHPEHNPPPPIPARSSSRGHVRNALGYRGMEHRKALPKAASVDENEVHWGLVNARRPTYGDTEHPGEHTRSLDRRGRCPDSEHRSRQSSELPRHITPPQPLHRYRGKPQRPSWW